MADTNRFATLDALRGLAAIGVMLFHAFPTGPLAATGGYLAVDLFFMLSGFVIAHAWEERLRQGHGARAFLVARAIRLWPMLLLGALLAIALHGGHAGLLLLLPNPLSPTLLYPANPPFWSLLFEVLAYLLFARFGARMGTAGLALVAGASGVTLAAFALAGPAMLVDFGADWRTLGPGLARLGFAFPLGMLVYRLRARQGLAHHSDPRAWLLMAALAVVMMAVPWRGSTAAPWGLAAILLAFPALLWLATCWDLPTPRITAWLGDMSYPLYCIHVPLLGLAATEGPVRPWACLALVLLAWGLDHLWDRPARRKLTALAAGVRGQTRIGIST